MPCGPEKKEKKNAFSSGTASPHKSYHRPHLFGVLLKQVLDEEGQVDKLNLKKCV